MAPPSTTSADGTLRVNGAPVLLDLPGTVPLLLVLRNDLGLNGPKYGCGLGQCGACTVLVDGVPARSCLLPLSVVRGRRVTTLEGLATDGVLHPVQRAFVEEQAAQCGYCLNGLIMTTVALLARDPSPDEGKIRRELAGNLCRCGTHVEILRAVRRAAEMMRAASISVQDLAPFSPGGRRCPREARADEGVNPIQAASPLIRPGDAGPPSSARGEGEAVEGSAECVVRDAVVLGHAR